MKTFLSWCQMRKTSLHTMSSDGRVRRQDSLTQTPLYPPGALKLCHLISYNSSSINICPLETLSVTGWKRNWWSVKDQDQAKHKCQRPDLKKRRWWRGGGRWGSWVFWYPGQDTWLKDSACPWQFIYKKKQIILKTLCCSQVQKLLCFILT